MVRWQVRFEPEEANAVLRVATAELRDPRDQIRHMVLQEMGRLGLLDGVQNGGDNAEA